MIWQETSTYNNEDNDNTPNDNGIGTIVPTPGRRRINPNRRLSEFCHRNRSPRTVFECKKSLKSRGWICQGIRKARGRGWWTPHWGFLSVFSCKTYTSQWYATVIAVLFTYQRLHNWHACFILYRPISFCTLRSIVGSLNLQCKVLALNYRFRDLYYCSDLTF